MIIPRDWNKYKNSYVNLKYHNNFSTITINGLKIPIENIENFDYENGTFRGGYTNPETGKYTVEDIKAASDFFDTSSQQNTEEKLGFSFEIPKLPDKTVYGRLQGVIDPDTNKLLFPNDPGYTQARVKQRTNKSWSTGLLNNNLYTTDYSKEPNAFLRLGRDWKKSPAYGFDNIIGNMLTGGYSSMAKSAGENWENGDYLTAGLKFLSPLAGPSVVSNPLRFGISVGAGILGGKAYDKAYTGITGNKWSDDLSKWTGLSTTDSELLNPGALSGFYYGDKLVSKPFSNFVTSAVKNKGIALSNSENNEYTWIPFNRSWSKGFSSIRMHDNNNGITFINSKYPGEGRKLYDSAIKGRGSVITGEHYISAPKTYRIMERYYPTREKIGDDGFWSNFNMLPKGIKNKSTYIIDNIKDFDSYVNLTKRNPELQLLVEFTNAPVYKLTSPYLNVSLFKTPNFLSEYISKKEW